MASGQAWSRRSSGISVDKVNCLFVAPNSQSFILAGTDSAIYRAKDVRTPFLPVLRNYGNFSAIHQITQNVQVSSSIYSATDAGVFVSDDQGRSWASIFSPFNPLARKALCVLVDKQSIYIGTADGLYVQANNQKTSKEYSGQIGRKPIVSLVSDQNYIYAATDSEIFRLQKSGPQSKVVYSLGKRLIDEPETDTTDEDVPLEKQIKDMIISADQSKIIVATEQRIISSTDQGESWKSLSLEGLPVNLLRKLSIDDRKNIFAATKKGVFVFQDGRWQSDMAGLDDIIVNDVKADEQGHLFLASNDGIYAKTKTKTVKKRHAASIGDESDHFESEPTIKEVQRMAIAYANVHPNQVNRWHNQARAKALLPTLSVGLNRGAGEMFHWDAGPNPDVLAKGRDYLDWSTSLSWNFSDFIWSSDQTTIDARSKLMNELRQDILDQVTRLYFERRRVQLELGEEFDLSSEDYLEKSLRLQELTALLDGLTGGGFTKNQEN